MALHRAPELIVRTPHPQPAEKALYHRLAQLLASTEEQDSHLKVKVDPRGADHGSGITPLGWKYVKGWK